MREEPENLEKRCWVYILPGDWTVLAGRTDHDNDMLSLKIADCNDYWFHVRGMPGSHVLLKVDPQRDEPPRDIVKQAAAIAAWHSKAREGGLVAVSCTHARFVTKKKGAKPGTVHIRKESVLKVRPAIPEKHDT